MQLAMLQQAYKELQDAVKDTRAAH